MIYLIHGPNLEKGREKAHSLIGSLQKKKPDALLFKLDTEHFSEGQLEELIGGQGLFEKKYIIFLDRIGEQKENRAAVLERLATLAESPNIFIFLEGKLDKASLGKFEKHAEKVQLCDGEDGSAASTSGAGKKNFGGTGTFNLFALGDAFGHRDRKELWLIYQKATLQEIPAEEVHGILFWAWRSVMLAASAKTASEAGLNPYVFQKSSSFAKNFKKEELADLGERLVRMYHEAHRGHTNFDIELEKFILGI